MVLAQKAQAREYHDRWIYDWDWDLRYGTTGSGKIVTHPYKEYRQIFYVVYLRVTVKDGRKPRTRQSAGCNLCFSISREVKVND